ncbi:LysR family transcriptional regulator [Noviherbaspirillum sedimenti]|uniref:LysR family transcriptional regulator n=1 Tax=Noviherbaspirillum sedimenti TaxID=2320865 RepID=A0A3A3G460_9BURK|nr:LysR family transcriptional regulator [Noviherbaspirillum sedimenti]RJG02634.1 LysR family transcriptional regulator [Noviherbaspirillum sedimenti]
MTGIDVHLLAIFNAIYKSRSVSGAAQALRLSQPTVSVALSKLRSHFGDQLFVRTSSGMAPTPFAEELVQPVLTVIEALDTVLGRRHEFNPASSDRTFAICMTDTSQVVLLPGLLKRLRAVAPGIRIRVVSIPNDLARQMEGGDIDLALGSFPQLEVGVYQQVLFLQNFVCMASKDHPRIAGTLTLEQFEAENHATIGSTGAAPQIIDHEIARQGIFRRTVLEIPNFFGAVSVVEHTDLIVTIPERLSFVLQGRGAYQVLPVPFPLPGYEVKQLWHQRYHNDPGVRWLRGVISELLSDTEDRSLQTDA